LSVSAEAVTECQLSFLSRERLPHLLQRHPVTALRLIHALSGELASARRHGRDLALKGAESRLAGLLIDLAGRAGEPHPGKPVQLGYGRRDLAEMIAVSTETAIRLLGRLKDKGVISTNRRELVINDVAKLRRIADHDEVAVA
jgi:CRP-like cAMP-binding protein